MWWWVIETPDKIEFLPAIDRVRMRSYQYMYTCARLSCEPLLKHSIHDDFFPYHWFDIEALPNFRLSRKIEKPQRGTVKVFQVQHSIAPSKQPTKPPPTQIPPRANIVTILSP